MSSTYTQSYTYTIADVRKVMDQIRADIRMAAESSGAMTLTKVDSIMSDVAKYAEKDYLSAVLVRLVGSDNVTIRAAEYEISTDAGTWTASRAGNMLWPQVGGSSIFILITTNATYQKIGSSARDSFQNLLGNPWPGMDRPSLANLSASADRNYVSNAYGAKKKNYL